MIATRRPLERPKNRSYWIAVLAGGRTPHLLKYRRQLAHYLIDLRYQLSIDHPKAFSRPLPLEADFVLLIKGIITHTQEAALLRRCKERSIRLIKTTDRWATMYRGLWDLGLRQAATPLSLLGDGVQELAEEAAETLCESCAQPLAACICPPAEAEPPPLALAPPAPRETIEVPDIVLPPRPAHTPALDEIMVYLGRARMLLGAAGIRSVMVSASDIQVEFQPGVSDGGGNQTDPK